MKSQAELPKRTGKQKTSGSGKKFVSIRTRMTAILLAVSFLLLALAGTAIMTQTRRETARMMDLSISGHTHLAMERADSYFRSFEGAMKIVASAEIIHRLLDETAAGGRSASFDDSELKPIAANVLQSAAVSLPEGAQSIFVGSGANGQGLRQDGSTTPLKIDIRDRPWWKSLEQSGKAEACLTDAYEDKQSGELVVTMAYPILNKAGKMIGAVAVDISLDHLTDMVNSLQVGQEGYVVMMDASGTVICHPDREKELREVDELAYSDDLKAAVHGDEAVYGLKFKEDGMTRHGAVVPLHVSGWRILGSVSGDEYGRQMSTMRTTIQIFFTGTIILLAVAIGISIAATLRPIKKLQEITDRLARGELDVEVELSHRHRDETTILADNVQRIVGRLKQYIVYIDEIAGALDQIGNRDLVFELEQDYTGEFNKLKEALNRIKSSLTDTMGTFVETAEHANDSSESMASGAQALAQGATEQASTVDQLADAVHALTDEANKGAESARAASRDVREIGQEIQNSNRHMQDMTTAMHNISERSEQIQKIVRAVEDLAFQTNILALNAAVEAARAGVAGKGFAVVADEVRNLAGKSSDAAQDITRLIQDTTAAVSDGVGIANVTAESLNTAADRMDGVVDTIDAISGQYQDAAQNLERISVGISQVSDVVQTNSATAEESAATAEELAAQVAVMKSLVASFHISEN